MILRSVIVLTVLALLTNYRAGAQPEDTLHVEPGIGSYLDARAIGIDPQGRVYVVDAGRHIVEVRDTNGNILFELGGPGSEEGEFDEPSGVDPTNGLAIVVADAGNARLQRFTGRYQLIESVPLYSRGPETLGSTVPSSTRISHDGRSSSRGRPTSVAVSSTGEIFAIDEAADLVVKWDATRKYAGTIGSSSTYARLEDPVDLDIIDDLLFVADRGRKRIVVYDLFGGMVTEFGRLHQLVGLAGGNGLLWVLHGQRVSVFTPSGTLVSQFVLSQSADYRDLTITRNALLLLSKTSFFRAYVEMSNEPGR